MQVLRLLNGSGPQEWHIAWVDVRFSEGAIVTLEGLCGKPLYGRLTRAGYDTWRTTHPRAILCSACQDHYHLSHAPEGGISLWGDAHE